MSYFIMAFIVWLVGKIFFSFYSKAKEEDKTVPLFAICFCLAAVPCGIIQCCTGSDKKEETKKVTLTVTNRVEKDDIAYLRFSDGYTLAIDKDYRFSNAEWMIVQKGDTVLKLIYPSGKCKYTPVFDEHSHE